MTRSPGAPVAVLAARAWDMYGNHWAFPAGERIRLDLAQVDQPTYRAPNPAVTATLDLTGTRLVLPVRQDSEITVS